ncbi:hypothetical protein NST99_29375 [Paenibacillus sp. FSL L8-0470]|uniref:hypothetical protein n=1 Tax=unclassified Paenibacillus TaxID=185978 RepID=UPI0030F9CE4A
MKKLASLTVAMGLMASIAATASAAEVTNTTTVTETTYSPRFETVITQSDLRPATPQIILTKATPFYASMNSPVATGFLGAQTLDTTGNILVDSNGNEWREIYTWLGMRWMKVPASAYVITP